MTPSAAWHMLGRQTENRRSGWSLPTAGSWTRGRWRRMPSRTSCTACRHRVDECTRQCLHTRHRVTAYLQASTTVSRSPMVHALAGWQACKLLSRSAVLLCLQIWYRAVASAVLGISRGAVPLHDACAALCALQLSHTLQTSASAALHHHRHLVLVCDKLARLGGCLMI